MIVYKDVISKLKDAGYSTYRIKMEGQLGEGTLHHIRLGEPVSLKTIDKICQMTGLPIEDIVEIKKDPE